MNSCNYVSGWLQCSIDTGSVHILASNYECEGMLCKRCKGVSIPNNLLSLSKYKTIYRNEMFSTLFVRSTKIQPHQQ